MWAIVKTPLNLIIRGVNALISGINKISFDVPDWVPFVGGKSLGFNIPTIQTLGTGGIIAKPTPAVVGEAGKEAVIPLENNTEGLELIADKLASKINASGGQYIIQLDGKTIKKGLAKVNQKMEFATNGR